jgi:plasmid stability protein
MFQTHSIRLPKNLFDVLKVRAATNRRSFNAEMVYILEQHVGGSVAVDLEVIRTLQLTQTEDGR